MSSATNNFIFFPCIYYFQVAQFIALGWVKFLHARKKKQYQKSISSVIAMETGGVRASPWGWMCIHPVRPQDITQQDARDQNAFNPIFRFFVSSQWH